MTLICALTPSASPALASSAILVDATARLSAAFWKPSHVGPDRWQCPRLVALLGSRREQRRKLLGPARYRLRRVLQRLDVALEGQPPRECPRSLLDWSAIPAWRVSITPTHWALAVPAIAMPTTARSRKLLLHPNTPSCCRASPVADYRTRRREQNSRPRQETISKVRPRQPHARHDRHSRRCRILRLARRQRSRIPRGGASAGSRVGRGWHTPCLWRWTYRVNGCHGRCRRDRWRHCDRCHSRVPHAPRGGTCGASPTLS